MIDRGTNIDFLSGTANSDIVKENCSLPADDGSVWVYANQTCMTPFLLIHDYYLSTLLVAVLAQFPSNGLIAETAVGQGSVSGLVGLGTNRGLSSSNSDSYTPTFSDSIYSQFLALNPDANNLTFGVKLQPPIRSPTGGVSGGGREELCGSASDSPQSQAGVINWLQPDETQYDPGSVIWAPVNNSLPVLATTDPEDWLISMAGWVFTNGDGSLVSNMLGMTANVDPLYDGIYLPVNDANLIRTLQAPMIRTTVVLNAYVHSNRSIHPRRSVANGEIIYGIFGSILEHSV